MADNLLSLTTPEDNVVRRMIDEKLAREDAAFKAATEVNKSIPAVDQAKAIPLAKENNIPTEVARRNLRELEVQKRQDNLRNIMLRSTSVSRLAADQDHGPIALEHADEIDQFETMLKAYKGDGVLLSLGKGVAQSAVGVAGGFAQFIASTGSNISPYLSGGLSVPTPTAVDRFMQSPLSEAPPEDKQAVSKTVTKLSSDVEKAIAYTPITDWERDLKAAFQRGEYGSALANVPGFAGEQLVVGLPNMLLAWFAPPVSLLAETGRVAQERAQNDGRDYVSGQDIAAAAPVGALITFGERFGLGKMLNPGTGLMAPVRGAVAEGGTEFLQESGEYLASTLGTQKGATLGGALEAGAAGFIGGAPGGAIVAGGKAVLDAYVFRAEKRRQDLVDLGDKIRSSKVANLSPDTLTALAQQIEADGGPQMSVPAEKLVQLFQSEGFTPEQIKQQFPEVAKALDDAEQGNAEVPLNAESIVKLVSLEGFEAISGDVWTGPNERTPNELKQVAKDFDAFVESLSDTEKKEAVRASIEDQLTKQLVAAGYEPRAAAVQARLWSSILTNIDERNVKDPGATLARYRLDITNNESSNTAAAGQARPGGDAGGTRGVQGTARPSLASRAQSIIRDLGNLSDAEARNLGLTAEDRDRVATLLNENKAPSPGPSSSGETTTLFQPFDGQGAPEASKAAQALADLKQTGFVTDQHVIGILGEFPGYLQEVAKFMAEQRQKLIEGRMTLRDVAKAYFITVSSMGSGAKSAEMVAAKTGMQVPQQFIENGKLRPEEAAAAWLGTPDGQAALDALERGEFREDLWQKGAAVRTAYGDDRHATMGSMKPAGNNQFSMQNLQGLVDEINATKGDSAKLQAAVTKLKGIGTGKQGFIGHLLGMGNVPTIDAVEINTWIAGQGDIAQLKNKRADLARRIKESSSDKRVSAELLDRITRRFEGLRKKVGADQVDPQVWQHIAHHWLWDRAKGIETTHGGLYEAMRFYQTSQTTTTTARGFIKFGPGRDFFQITLTGKADLSTFNHEMMHYALEVIQDLVQKGEASPQLVADLQKLREFAGLEEGEPIERRHHEQIARAWEAYVMEGRSPYADLQGVFNRMRAWMVFIYKRLAALDVELTDEVRGVFDRLVASDAQIAEARTQIGWSKPLPKEALYLSDDEYDRYVEAWNKASEAQQREVDAKLMLEAAREAQAAWREERAKVMEEEQKKLAATRGHRAWKLLSEGIGLDDAAPGRTSLKIDPDTVPSEWRRDTTGMTEEGGLPLEAVAEILGFDSGEQMISLIAGAKFAERDLSAKVRQIMAERHGDMDATALADVAMAAVHSDDTQEVLLTEFRAMAQKAGIPAPPPGLSKWMAAQAEQKVRALTRRQLDPTRWRRAELKAATDAAKAAAKGDVTKAAIHKRQQMMAAAMYRATVQADKRVDVIRKKLLPFTKNDRRAKLGKAGDLYLDGIDEILEGVQLKQMSAKAADKITRLEKLVEEANANGEPLVLPDKLRAMLGKKNFADMTLEELEGVHDAVMNIWHLAKLKNELKARNEKRELEEALTEMEANAQAALGDPKVTVLFTEGWKERATNTLRKFRAGLTKMEFLFGWLDGKPDGGLMHRLIYQPIADANHEKFKIMRRFHETIIERMRNLPNEQKARWESKRTFMGNSTANGATIISAALNLGNEGNKKKLLEGYGWNEQQLMAEINAFMTKADWDFVQHVWDEIDTLWPRIEATTKAATGLAPEKVVASPVVTPFGTYAGGYYPVVYDPNQTEQQFKNQQQGEGLFTNNFARPTLGDGFTKARVDYAAPLLLKLDVISRHLAEVVHYVTHYQAVTQADKITRHPRFQALVKGHMGKEFYRYIRPWLQDVARDQDTPAVTNMEPFAQAARYLRGGVSIGAMGYNIFTGLKQLIGIVQSLDAIGPRYWLQGLSESWLSPNAIANWKEAFSESQELWPLVTQFDRDIKMINDAYAKQGAMSVPSKVASWAFKHIGWLQAAVNVATWRGAYAQEFSISKDHQKAVMHADAVVRKTQSAGAVKDLSPIQRGSEINRAVSMFYSWFNVLYNRLEDIAKQTKGVKDVPRAAARVAILVMMSSMVEEAGRRAWEAIVDNYEDDEEEAGYILSVLMKSADTLVGAIPMARVFASAGAAAGGLPPELFPAGRVVSDYYRTIGAARDFITKGEAPSRGEVKTAVRTVSALTHVPLSGPYNFLDEIFGEAVFGEGKKTKP